MSGASISTLKGCRSINLGAEVKGARSLLDDARITLRVNGAATNVLRHSDATHVDLHLSDFSQKEPPIAIADDEALEEDLEVLAWWRKRHTRGHGVADVCVLDLQLGGIDSIDTGFSAQDLNR